MSDEHYELAYNPQKNYVLLTRKQFAKGEAFQSPTMGALDLAKQKQTTKLLIDDRKLGIISQEDRDWIINTFYAACGASGLLYVAVVRPEKLVGKAVLDKILTNEANLALEGAVTHESKDFDSFDEAEQWLVSR